VQVVPLPGKGMGCVATRKGFHKPYSKEFDKNVQQLLSDIVFVIFAAILPFFWWAAVLRHECTLENTV
jgi:hypothetical protein